MSSFWENKYLNSEKSIQFIQEAHTEVLKGLHSEIETLQKQCADYALRLSLQAGTSVEKEEYDKKFKTFNVEYKKKDALINEQKKLIEERNKSIRSLEERVRTLEKKYDNDMVTKDNLIKQYKSQIDKQSAEIANLTYQLHNLKNLKQSIDMKQSDSEPQESKQNPKRSSTPRALRKSKNVNNEVVELSPRKNYPEESQNESEFLNFGPNEARQSSANSNSARSDRSSTPPIKVLPPVVKRPPPDPKPFLLSAASTLHTRNRKDYLQRKALISLPPIKPYELNQLVVESPLKIGHNNSQFIQSGTTHDQNNTPTS